MTFEGLLAFFDRYLRRGSDERRRLSTHVFASGIAPKALRVDELAEAFFEAEADGLLAANV